MRMLATAVSISARTPRLSCEAPREIADVEKAIAEGRAKGKGRGAEKSRQGSPIAKR
jgi:hypothetical protein